MSITAERMTLEDCAAACKRALDRAREEENELKIAMLESDLNGILEQLGKIYSRQKVISDRPKQQQRTR